MDMIAASEVIHRIETYFEGGAVAYLSAAQAKLAESVVSGEAAYV
jgi:hypothetical protein